MREPLYITASLKSDQFFGITNYYLFCLHNEPASLIFQKIFLVMAISKQKEK